MLSRMLLQFTAVTLSSAKRTISRLETQPADLLPAPFGPSLGRRGCRVSAHAPSLSSPSDVPASDDDLWPLRIRLTRRPVGNGLWECDSWHVSEIESDRDGAATEGVSCSEDTTSRTRHYDWRARPLRLFRDERAAYRFNLESRTPRLFVQCDPDDGGLMVPTLVTASQDVAASYMDGGDEHVFSVEMPAAIQCWIEAFIARHGEPEIFLGKGRRRQRGKQQPDADRHD